MLVVATIAAILPLTACGGDEPSTVTMTPPADAPPTLAMARIIPGSPHRGSIVTVDVAGDPENELRLDDGTPTAAIAAVWSRDGRSIAVTRSLGMRQGDAFEYEASDIWVTGADGRGTRRLTTTEDGASPAWAPDGRTIAFTHMTVPTRGGPDALPRSTAAIWLVPVAGGEETRLTDPRPGSVDVAGSFSPDGATLAFTRCDFDRPYMPIEAPNPCSVFLIQADGSQLRRLAPRAQDPDWAPNGDTIFYASDQAENGVLQVGEDESAYALDLYRMRSDGRAPTRITDTPKLSESEPRVSPGGELLAYTQVASDYDRQVAIANLDATCPRQLKPDTTQDTSGQYSAPAWRPGSAATERPLAC